MSIQTPLDVVILFSIPTLLAGLYAAWTVWRSEHPRVPPAK